MCLKQNLESSVKLRGPIHTAIWGLKWVAIKKRPHNFYSKQDKTATKDGTLHKDLHPSTTKPEVRHSNIIHSSHLSVKKCKTSVWDVLFLPDMNDAIKDQVSCCEVCSSDREQNVTETTYTTWDSWLPFLQGWQRPFGINKKEKLLINALLPKFYTLSYYKTVWYY